MEIPVYGNTVDRHAYRSIGQFVNQVSYLSNTTITQHTEPILRVISPAVPDLVAAGVKHVLLSAHYLRNNCKCYHVLTVLVHNFF
jgi:hypothetical protein